MYYPLILLIRILAFCEPFSRFFGITEYHLENLLALMVLDYRIGSRMMGVKYGSKPHFSEQV